MNVAVVGATGAVGSRVLAVLGERSFPADRTRAFASERSAGRELGDGVVVVDDPADGIYPLAIDVEGRDEVLVGRIRRDPSHERCLNLWIVGDNLRKGAATNAVQLAELLHVRGLLPTARAA